MTAHVVAIRSSWGAAQADAYARAGDGATERAGVIVGPRGCYAVRAGIYFEVLRVDDGAGEIRKRELAAAIDRARYQVAFGLRQLDRAAELPAGRYRANRVEWASTSFRDAAVSAGSAVRFEISAERAMAARKRLAVHGGREAA